MSAADGNNEQCSGGGGGEITSNREECTSCEQNNVDAVTEGIDSIAILNDVSTCANCGKEGNSDDMNTCNKCKEVKYCNAACKKKHRSKHKKKCDRRVAELHDEKLFKEPPPQEDCPICFIPQSSENNTQTFQSCCGKVICHGCIYAIKMSEGKDLCAFCRTPPAVSDEENISRTKKLMNDGNAHGYYLLAGYYRNGEKGFPQDDRKANELLLKAGEFGCSDGYHNLGNSYLEGRAVERDMKKAKYYWELAAMMGHVKARHNLGVFENQTSNTQRALKHYILAARAGHEKSLEVVKSAFTNECITKDRYADILRTYQKRRDEMKSDAREKARVSGLFRF